MRGTEQDALAALSDAASAGLWAQDGTYIDSRGRTVPPVGLEDAEPWCVAEANDFVDAEFIVALVNAYRSGALVPAARLAEAERLLHRAAEHIGWTDDDLDNEVPAFLAGVSTRDWCALRVRLCGRADDHLPHVWHPAEHPDMRCLGAFIAEGD